MGFFDDHLPSGRDEDEDFVEDDDLDDEPSERWVGGVVPLEAVVARSDRAAIVIRDVVAYRDGFELTVIAFLRRATRRPWLGSPFVAFDPDELEGGALPDELVRIGLVFPDGAVVTNLAGTWRISDDATEPAHGMEPTSGGGTELRMEQQFWVWPLPGPGTLTIVCEWPAQEIAEARLDVDAAPVAAAGARAIPIWPDEVDTPSHLTMRQRLGGAAQHVMRPIDPH